MPDVGLHGREEEQRRIAGLLDRPVHDGPRVLIVSGEAGIGKTRLLSEAAHRARQRGIAVHHHRPAGSGVLVPAGPPPHPHVAGLSSLHVVDDVRDLTAGDLRTVLATVRQDPAPSPTLLLARSATAQAPPPSAVAGVGVDLLELSPLTAGAVRDLVRDLIEVEPKPGLLDVVTCAHGNPRLIVELVEGLAEDGRIGPEGELLRLTPRQLPARVRAAIDDHLRPLSRESVQLLRVGTILGRTFSLSQAAALLGTGTAALLPALDETVAAGLLTFADDGVCFRHALVRRAVYESIPAAVRAALRQEAQRYGDQAGAPEHGPAEPGRRERARKRHGPVPGEANATAAARLLLQAGHTESVVLLVRSALGRPLPAHEERVLRGLLTGFMLAGGRAGAAFAADPVVSASAGSLPLPPPADAWADAVLDRLAVTGPQAEQTAALVLSGLEWAEGRTGPALHWGRRAVELSVPSDAPADGAYPRLALAAKLVALGGTAEADQFLRQITAGEPVDQDDLAFRLAGDLVRAAAHLRSGNLDAARRQALDVQRTASDHGLRVLTAWASAALCRTDLLAGDTDAAAAHLAECRASRSALKAFPHLAVHCHWLDVLLHAARNKVREASGLLAVSPGPLPSSRPLLLAEPGAAAWFVRFSRRTGDPALADAALRTVERLATDNPEAPGVRLAALHARSLYECDPDGIARAARDHQDAWARACAAEDLRALLDERQTAPGTWEQTPQPQPRPPHGTFTTRDLVGRMTFVDPTDHQRQAFAERTVEALTDTERRIAGLVAQGLTNRQVAQRVRLSPHTVNYYLRRIYGKLGIRSRVELARHVHDHGLERNGPTIPRSEARPRQA